MQQSETKPTGPGQPRRVVFARPYLFALLLAAIGVFLAWNGARLAGLGGSPYYLITGIAVIVSAVLVAMGRWAGAKLYFLMLVATLAWALWEAGFDPWALAPRLVAPWVLGIWFLIPWTRRRTSCPGS